MTLCRVLLGPTVMSVPVNLKGDNHERLCRS